MPLSLRLLAPVVLLLALAAPAGAAGIHGVGPRVGVGFAPNQVVFGGHADFGDLFPRTGWTLPFVEVGLGDSETWLSAGTALLFRAPGESGGWSGLVGGEVAVQFLSVPGEDSTDLGLTAVVGADRPIGDGDRFALHLKFGIIDAPSVRLLAVWTFGN